jgi:hypothetical protein
MSYIKKFKSVMQDVLELIWGTEDAPKRSRGNKGRFKADNKATKDVNEAWVGGKSPKKKTRKYKKKKSTK